MVGIIIQGEDESRKLDPTTCSAMSSVRRTFRRSPSERAPSRHVHGRCSPCAVHIRSRHGHCSREELDRFLTRRPVFFDESRDKMTAKTMICGRLGRHTEPVQAEADCCSSRETSATTPTTTTTDGILARAALLAHAASDFLLFRVKSTTSCIRPAMCFYHNGPR
jgi:hypothetical protein